MWSSIATPVSATMFRTRGANQFVLNEEERAELRAVLLRNPALRQARDLLQNRMFNNGITLVHISMGGIIQSKVPKHLCVQSDH